MKKIKIFLFLLALSVSFLGAFSSAGDANALTPTCAPNDGCYDNCIVTDTDCINMGVPVICPQVPNSRGLIPCGRDYDDPASATLDECEPCTLCHLVLMIHLIILFMIKVSAVFTLLAIILGGFLYIVAAGSSGTIEKAKTIIKYSLLGFLVVFIAWALVESILVTMGYIDPIDGIIGGWENMSC